MTPTDSKNQPPKPETAGSTAAHGSAVAALARKIGGHIRKPMTLHEICVEIDGDEYSAELMLHHLVIWAAEVETELHDHLRVRNMAPLAAPPLFGPSAYQPEIWRVEKDTIYAAIPALESGLEYARECLATHETSLGRTTLKNKTWAETMEKDIRHMERTMAMLRACGPNIRNLPRDE